MYITVIVLVLLFLFYRKEDFTLYFKNLGPGSHHMGASTQTGYTIASDLSHLSPGSLSFLSGADGAGGARGARGTGESGGDPRPPVGTGLVGPMGNPVSV